MYQMLFPPIFLIGRKALTLGHSKDKLFCTCNFILRLATCVLWLLGYYTHMLYCDCGDVTTASGTIKVTTLFTMASFTYTVTVTTLQWQGVLWLLRHSYTMANGTMPVTILQCQVVLWLLWHDNGKLYADCCDIILTSCTTSVTTLQWQVVLFHYDVTMARPTAVVTILQCHVALWLLTH